MEITSQSLADTYSQKSDEELTLLHKQGTLTALAYDVIEAEMQRRGITVPQRPTSDLTENAGEREFRRLTLKAHWAGEAPLASAYWLLGTLGGWVIVGIAALVESFAPQFLVIADLLLLAFFVFASVSIWRCAPNSSWTVWGYMARAVVVLMSLIVFTLIYGAFVSGEY